MDPAEVTSVDQTIASLQSKLDTVKANIASLETLIASRTTQKEGLQMRAYHLQLLIDNQVRSKTELLK